MEPKQVAEQLSQAFEASWNAHDMAAFGAIFHADASFVNRYGMLWLGRPAIEAGHRFIHEGVYRDTTVANQVVRAEAIAPGVVLIHLLGRMQMGPSIPWGPRASNTLMLIVATEQDGGWLIRSAENVQVSNPETNEPELAWPHPMSPLPAA